MGLPIANQRIAERDRRINERAALRQEAAAQRRAERYIEMLQKVGAIHFVTTGGRNV